MVSEPVSTPDIKRLPPSSPPASPPTSPSASRTPSPSFAQYGANARIPSASNRVKRELARSNPSLRSASSNAIPGTDVVCTQVSSTSSRAVFLNVYDITTPDDPELIPRINSALLPLGIGLFHSGVEVYGVEYAFGGHYDDLSGIFTCFPKRADGVIFRSSIPLGDTPLSEKNVRALIEVLGESRFMGNAYSLVGNNCNSFSQFFVSLLNTPRPFPAWVNRMATIASSVSCILPESVEQPLSELAPTAVNLERRRSSITGPPPEHGHANDEKHRKKQEAKTFKTTDKRSRCSKSRSPVSAVSENSSNDSGLAMAGKDTGSGLTNSKQSSRASPNTASDGRPSLFETALVRPISETSTVSDRSLHGAIIDDSISDVLSPASSYCNATARSLKSPSSHPQPCDTGIYSGRGIYEPCDSPTSPRHDPLADLYRASSRMCVSPKAPTAPPRIASSKISSRMLESVPPSTSV